MPIARRPALTNADIDGGYDPTAELLCSTCFELRVVLTDQYAVCEACGAIQPRQLISDGPSNFEEQCKAPDKLDRPSFDALGQLALAPDLSTKISESTAMGRTLARMQRRAKAPRIRAMPGAEKLAPGANPISDQTVARRTEDGKRQIDRLATNCGLSGALVHAATQYWFTLRAREGHSASKMHDLRVIAAVCVFLATYQRQDGLLLSRLAFYASEGDGDETSWIGKIRRGMNTYHALLGVRVPSFWEQVEMAIRYLFYQASQRVKRKIDKRTGLPGGVGVSHLVLEQALRVAREVGTQRGTKDLTCSKVEVAACACLMLAQQQGEFCPVFTTADLSAIRGKTDVPDSVISRKKDTYIRLLYSKSQSESASGSNNKKQKKEKDKKVKVKTE